MDVRVLVVDGHSVTRAALRMLVEAEAGLTAVGEAETAHAAELEARSVVPDVILLDGALPDEHALQAASRLLDSSPGAKILVLALYDDPRYVHDVFAAGASGYVLKDALDSEISAAIREVAGGRRFVSAALAARFVAYEAAEARLAADDPLSDRERAVLRLLALGHTNREIATTLYISIRTVETHRASIMQKLALSNRAELVRYALERGLLESMDRS